MCVCLFLFLFLMYLLPMWVDEFPDQLPFSLSGQTRGTSERVCASSRRPGAFCGQVTVRARGNQASPATAHAAPGGSLLSASAAKTPAWVQSWLGWGLWGRETLRNDEQGFGLLLALLRNLGKNSSRLIPLHTLTFRASGRDYDLSCQGGGVCVCVFKES